MSGILAYVGKGLSFLIWGGAKQPDICAQLTGVSAQHWAEHSDSCADLVQRKAYLFLFSLLMVGALYGTVLCSSGLCIRLVLVDPVCRAFLRGRNEQDR